MEVVVVEEQLHQRPHHPHVGRQPRQPVAARVQAHHLPRPSHQSPAVVSESSAAVSESPAVVSEYPTAVSESPLVVSESPFVVSESRAVVSVSSHSREEAPPQWLSLRGPEQLYLHVLARQPIRPPPPAGRRGDADSAGPGGGASRVSAVTGACRRGGCVASWLVNKPSVDGVQLPTEMRPSGATDPCIPSRRSVKAAHRRRGSVRASRPRPTGGAA